MAIHDLDLRTTAEGRREDWVQRVGVRGVGAGTALSGTFTPTNGSAAVATSVSQVGALAAGDYVVLASQADRAYKVQSVTSTTVTLTLAFAGSTGATTAKKGANPFITTPDSGKVRISYTDGAGVTRYWNGSAFVTGDPIDLATTISGQESRYVFTVPTGIQGQNLVFEGWVNDDQHTYDRDVVRVAEQTPSAKLKF